jgi:hypothetical protein
VAVLDLSSFKCGHDAPTYGIIDSIIEKSARAPYSALHDIDANKPGGSIKIRVKTYAHSLKLARGALEDISEKKRELARRIDEKRLELLEMKRSELDRRAGSATRRSRRRSTSWPSGSGAYRASGRVARRHHPWKPPPGSSRSDVARARATWCDCEHPRGV